jgi:hypothetical protein
MANTKFADSSLPENLHTPHSLRSSTLKRRWSHGDVDNAKNVKRRKRQQERLDVRCFPSATPEMPKDESYVGTPPVAPKKRRGFVAAGEAAGPKRKLDFSTIVVKTREVSLSAQDYQWSIKR